VAIVANHPIARVGLRVLLSELPAASVVHEMAVGEGPGEEPANDVPCWDSVDVVIIDAVPSLAAHFDFTCRLQLQYDHLKLVVVVDGDDGRVLADLVDRGIDGILTPDDLADGLATVVQQVADGQRVASLNTVVRYVRRRPGGGKAQEDGLELTADELRILHMVADGLRNREIALQEFVSEPTVKRRTQKIYRKLQARDRAHAVSLATRRGIL
jgi:two-component system nitrate/nitrite response regulator NarP